MSSLVCGLRCDLPFEERPLEPLLPAGTPWARWASLDGCSGWHTIGIYRPVRPVSPPPFWNVVLLVATELGNGRLDSVHSIGSASLSVGGLGLLVGTGAAEALLLEYLETAPIEYVREMAPTTQSTGVYLSTFATAQDSPIYSLDDPHLRHVNRGPLTKRYQIDGAVRGGSVGETWTDRQKNISRTWVESVSSLLSYNRIATHLAHIHFCEHYLPPLLTPVTRSLLLWPTNGGDDAWMFTVEQQMLWVLALVLALVDPKQTEELFIATVEQAPDDARATLYNIQHATPCEGCQKPFLDRAQQALSILADTYGVK